MKGEGAGEGLHGFTLTLTKGETHGLVGPVGKLSSTGTEAGSP